MPKQAGLILAFLLSCLTHTIATAQQDLPVSNGKQYEIGEISVVGAKQYNEQTVIAFTRLRSGDLVYLPGDRISNVIKKLWDLDLFSDINLYATINGDKVDLKFEIEEVPELNKVTINGIKEKKAKDIIKDNDLNKGTKVTENLITKTKFYIENKYKKEGYLNSKVTIITRPATDTVETQKVDMLVNVELSDRVKIEDIEFIGNEQLSDAKLRKQMKNTKQKNIIRFWKRSKYIAENFAEDKVSVVDKYKENGFRDARIISDTLIHSGEDLITLKLYVEEGNKYHIGDIDFLGNTVYSDKELARQLGLEKGDVYNGVLLKERISKDGDPNADDLSNLYKNSGYLFSTINPVETKVENDTIDFEIRITEGKLAYFDRITITGNDKTKDRVIYRNLRTRPGQRYSQAAVLQTTRELGQTGFFDPEQLNPQFLNANPYDGTIDINYALVEQGASQIELQGGYGGGGFVGTLGLSFNNFSIQNLFNKDAYQPLPMGDGQKFSLRAQASTFYQTYSASLTEPWLGGKKPVQLQLSFSHSIQYRFDFNNRSRGRPDKDSRFLITGGSIGLAKRLEVPDNYFTISHAISFQHFDLKNYNVGLFTFGNGSSENLAYTVGISRNETDINPIFPRTGSKFSLTAKLTPPYSLWNGTDYKALADERAAASIEATQAGRERVAEIDQERFNWLEYYKVKFEGQWFTSLVGKFVLSSKVDFGFLGAYNNDRGIPPFDRFYLGGDGLGGYALDGREVIRLRGYPNQSVLPQDRSQTTTSLDRNDGATIFNKFEFELRYPITLKPSASIYALMFAEAGASFDNFRNYNPFLMNRSAGAGVRIYMPAFGLLGIDFGYGFDPIPGTVGGPNGWETHFIIGQQF
ncbi:Beta-barrel assembly machine subunit BamA [Leeuwenhoekiella aestuarii]|uniref:Outer membrane protein assembly factor BamA n=1 Tax=Leeuwenhoekiella aestuarii TaxID=2249426 RepID=A0A4Q0NSH5_9FLAO|nr:outer membrane protein assembly factor BamA [Leeuwenhoekiella aestuarii]RXG14085.1 Beta-barrel assembly machine subunit BamA [Leeuwenhoekiella aestuarii]RXG18834.1 Beta-barrel assembly machine subunit BamA [Leeuwenhoekiella aestuarii]